MELCDARLAALQHSKDGKTVWYTVPRRDWRAANPFKPGDKVIPRSFMLDGLIPEVVPSVLIVEDPSGDHTYCYVDRAIGHRDYCWLETNDLIKIGAVEVPRSDSSNNKYKLADSWYMAGLYKMMADIMVVVTNYTKENK